MQEAEASSQFPLSITFRPGDERCSVDTDNSVLSTKIFIRFEHLSNLFLIERLLGRLVPLILPYQEQRAHHKTKV